MPFVLPHASVSAPPPGGVIRNGLISRWPYDDGTGSTIARDDQSTNTGNLDPTVNPALQWVEGRLGGDTALRLTTSSHKVVVADVAELDSPNISITAWFKFTSNPAAWAGLIAKTNTSWNEGYGIFMEGNEVNFFYGDYTRPAFFPLLISDRDWHLVIGTFDGTTKRIYLDDIEGTPEATAESPQSTTNDLWMGNIPNGRVINGDVQDHRLYNRVLNAGERTAIFSGTG